MSIFVDRPACSECYNTFESFGMICVHFGCCSDDEKDRYTSRIALHKRLLQDDLTFDRWADDEEVRKLQERNVAFNVAWHKEKIAEYEAKLKEIDDD